VRIGVLNNLRAGRRRPAAARIAEVLRGRTDVVSVETGGAHELAPALAELEQREIDVLVLNGGDGTVQCALSALLRDPTRERVPAIAPLRGGRTNATSTDLGADRDPARGLARLLAAADAGQLDRLAVARPVLRVRSPRRGADQYGMFFGAGLIYRAIQLVHRAFPPERQGVFGAGLVTGALVGKVLLRPTSGILTPDKCQVRLDGRELVDAELYLLIASTLDTCSAHQSVLGARAGRRAAHRAREPRAVDGDSRRRGSSRAGRRAGSRASAAMRASAPSAPSCGSAADSRSTESCSLPSPRSTSSSARTAASPFVRA
jgi:hypothetical protein